jgi:hypothetical protein
VLAADALVVRAKLPVLAARARPERERGSNLLAGGLLLGSVVAFIVLYVVVSLAGLVIYCVGFGWAACLP